MKRVFRNILFAVAVMLATSGIAATDAEVQAHSSALTVAGAFSNDGFKIRDGQWLGSIASKQPKIIQVNLFAGNQYWFVVAAGDGAKRISVSVYDEAGRPVATEPYENNGQSAAGFAPPSSGPYYVRVEEVEGTPATFCFIYSYK